MEPDQKSALVTAIVVAVVVTAAIVAGIVVLKKRSPARRPAIAPVLSGMPSGFVPISPGTFTMGSPTTEPGRLSDEAQHRVTISHGFYMEATDVTQGEWHSLMGNNPLGGPACVSCPVVEVSWWDAVTYANSLSEKEGLQQCYDLSGCRGTPGAGNYLCRNPGFVGLSCSGYRLPTEAEWEYAARAGTTTGTYDGTSATTDCTDPNKVLDPIAWFCGNAANTVHRVAQKKPNAAGLFDMLGNVWQWVGDWYGPYPNPATTDPMGPTSGTFRVFRGGSWLGGAYFARAAVRGRDDPGKRNGLLGFRLVRSRP